MVADNPKPDNNVSKDMQKAFERDGIDPDEVLEKAHSSIGEWTGYFSLNLKEGRDDAEFIYRDMWGQRDRQSQSLMLKPSMSFNKLRPTVRKIVAEQRQNKPDLIVRSLNGRATEQEIDLRADMVRSISYQSQCDLVYQSAFNSALTRGFGAFQVCVDYENSKSFKQVIRYDLVQDVSTVAFDPSAVEPHKGDGDFCARLYMMSAKAFAAKYPLVENPNSFANPTIQQSMAWSKGGEQDKPLVICDYYDKQYEPFKILLLSNGVAVDEQEWEELQKELEIKKQLASESSVLRELIEQDIPTVVGERMSERYKIFHYRLLNDTVLQYAEWPSKYLPLIFVDGDSQYIDGQQYTNSFVHDARDAQRFYNYVYSEIAAEVKNRRKEQWLATPDNVAGFEQMWKNPEVQRGALIAKPDPKTGQMPAKLPPWELSQSLLALCQQSTQDMREIMGFAETELSGSRDISGKAKMQRRLDAAQSTYVYHDNLNQAIAQGGRIVLDLLPVVYGGDERGFVLSKADGSSQPTVLNQKAKNGKIINALERGDYDIEIDTGPSFAVQKEAALELFMGLVQSNPGIFPMVADLIAKNLDVQFRPQIEERFKNFVPPEIIAKEEGKPLPPPKPNPEEQMAKMQLQLMQQELKDKEQALQINKQNHERQAEIDLLKQQIEKAKLYLEATKIEADKANNITKHGLEKQKVHVDYLDKMEDLIRATNKPERN